MSAAPLKLLLVAGARPNFMKVAPIIQAIRRHTHERQGARPLVHRLLHTGQHYDEKMSKVFFDDLGIPEPDDNLNVGSGSHAEQTASVMLRFEPLCVREKPDWVVVVGDVNSTMACTLVCAKLGIRVAHVEAGLRSFDRGMPEEVNRIVTDALADLLLTPSEDAADNLLREGVDTRKIKFVGNVMIDALVANLDRARATDVLKRLGLREKGFIYVTLHRPANVDEQSSLVPLMQRLRDISAHTPIVFPMHPRTRKMCTQFGIGLEPSPAFHVLDPIGYHESLRLTEAAALVLTDSGGLQEESTYFLTPCLTLRSSTERPVTVTIGSNRLTDIDRLTTDLEDCLAGRSARGSVPPLWDGQSSTRIVDRIVEASI